MHPAAVAAAVVGLALAALVVLPLLTAGHGGGRTLGRISAYVAGSDTITGATGVHPLANSGIAAPSSAGGGGSQPLTVYNMPTVLVPLTSPTPIPPPAQAAAPPPPAAPAAPASSDRAKVLDNPNNTYPPTWTPTGPTARR